MGLQRAHSCPLLSLNDTHPTGATEDTLTPTGPKNCRAPFEELPAMCKRAKWETLFLREVSFLLPRLQGPCLLSQEHGGVVTGSGVGDGAIWGWSGSLQPLIFDPDDTLSCLMGGP